MRYDVMAAAQTGRIQAANVKRKRDAEEAKTAKKRARRERQKAASGGAAGGSDDESG